MNHRWKRQVLLFLLAILLPAGVLLTLAVRLVRQEAELASKRVDAARRDAAEELRRELSVRLDAIKLSFATESPKNPAIVFIARLEQDRMVLPWEDRPARSRPSAAFTKLQREGELSEFQKNDPVAAAVSYKDASAAAKSSVERCQSSLRLGRVLYRNADKTEATKTVRVKPAER